ncbi:MAG: 4-hydroxythreonine-4-phosphate dehydrogenase PdxA [Gammaproteobacteria bacterium]|nr:4-hydroxythreonine-4-phosphate dehydrogenase PdxA [Gammaproteobacteria bacterium]
MRYNKLALSIGEPAGIGPDQILMLFNDHEFLKNSNNIFIAFADPELLIQRAELLNLKINTQVITSPDIPNTTNPNSLYIINTQNNNHANYTPVILDKNNSEYVINSLVDATTSCLEKQCDALITCPINKHIINEAGINFTGHTEFIAELCNNFKFSYTQKTQENNYTPVMLLMGRDYHSFHLKVALITTHLPVTRISENITVDNIVSKIQLINSELINKFGIAQPKIMVTGLNPHAGENGTLGSEELEIIIPALNILKKQCNINLTGPLSADSIFTAKNIKDADIIIAMYHDQGLTGFKARCLNNAANVTLGLPIIRTSVDHGTALDLAGTGNISIESLKYAIYTANVLINSSKKYDH